jgi:hypothetical protein
MPYRASATASTLPRFSRRPARARAGAARHAATFALALAALPLPLAAQRAQKPIARAALMPDLPSPLEVRDWKAVARGFDALLFDAGARGQFLPLFQRDTTRLNAAVDAFFVPSYVGDNRQTPGAQEAITTMGALLGASLVGIDHTADGADWVLGQLSYYNTVAGLLLNNVGRGPYPGYTFWYELFPAMLFTGLVWKHPRTAVVPVALTGGGTTTMREAMLAVARRWRDAAERLGGADGPGFDVTSFNFSTMQPVRNGTWTEPDGAAGIAWLQYMAWVETGDRRFLQAADTCLRWLERFDRNPFYETLLPFGAYLAARMNAEQGRDYDVARLLDWCFGPSDARPGWGVVTDRWGGYDVHGLMGSLTDGGGYAFAMNTFDAAAALVPLVRYDARFARDVGKWMLNLASAARLFYGTFHPADRQSSSFWKGDPQGVVAYEGLRKDWDGKSPYATGDPIRSGWGKTDLGLYGSSHVGFLGAIVSATGDPAILQLDLLATDFFHGPSYPTFLYWNPYPDRRTVALDVGTGARDLYSATVKRFVVLGATGRCELTLEPRSALVIVIVPAGAARALEDGRLLADGVVIDYQAAAVTVAVGTPSGAEGGALPVSLETVLAPGVEFASLTLAVDGAVVRRGVAPTGRLLLDPGPYADGGSHEISATLETAAGTVAGDRVRFTVDTRPLAAYGAKGFLAWKPYDPAPGRLTIAGSAAHLDEADPAGDRGGIVSPPVWLDFSRSPVLVFDGLSPGNRWALLARFPRSPGAGTLVIAAPSRISGRIEIDLRAAVDSAARKARVASPAAAPGLVPVELVLETVGEGSRLSFFHEHVDLVYREER